MVDETCWTDAGENGLSAYRCSRTLAESTAWDFAAQSRSFSLTTMLPGAVLGLTDRHRRSARSVLRLGLEIVDARDVAAAHLMAMTSTSAEDPR